LEKSDHIRVDECFNDALYYLLLLIREPYNLEFTKAYRTAEMTGV